MWKLPMFGCTDSAQVLREVDECKKAYPSCWVRRARAGVRQREAGADLRVLGGQAHLDH